MPVTIAPMQLHHVPQVVRLHAKALPEDMFPLLGEGVMQLFYQQLLRSEEGFGFVAGESDRCIGFVSGTTLKPGMYQRAFMKTVPALVLQLALRAMTRPRRLVRALFRLVSGSRGAETDAERENAELMAIALDSKYLDQGIGTQLVNALEERFRSLNVGGYQLGVREDNARAIRFYEARGFRQSSSCVFLGRPMRIYKKTFTAIREPHLVGKNA